jgi:hypothetical protein
MRKSIVYSALIGLAGLTCLSAQESMKPAFQIGVGFAQGIGRTGYNTDLGLSLSAGVGLNFGQRAGLMLDVNDSNLGINSTTLTNIGVPGGKVNIFSATIDPVLHVTPHNSHADIYVTGGAGLYRRYQEFTAPTIATGFGFNPWFGFYPTAVPVTTILSSYSVNKIGFDVGIGVGFGAKWHGKFYGEAKYNRMAMGGFHTDYLPVTFGFRW